jgi:hypothetical protein
MKNLLIICLFTFVHFVAIISVNAESKMTNENYFKISQGMTYDEVKSILGEGKLVTSKSDNGDGQFISAIFMWGRRGSVKYVDGKFIKRRSKKKGYILIGFTDFSDSNNIKSGKVDSKMCCRFTANPVCSCDPGELFN